ncbi:MAG: SH3 domain-containing protein [Clostridia bacterium]|nr:SH3 domain-containing protein [Clostridia bacterium]
MRKLWILLFALLLALSCCAMAAGTIEAADSEEQHVAGYALINTGKGTLNMRSQAKSNAKVVAKLPNKALVQVLEFGPEWSQVTYTAKNGPITGFVMTSFLEETEPPPPPVEEEEEPEEEYVDLGPYAFARVTTTQGTLNMRNQAKDGARVVARLPNNALVHVHERAKTWSRVTHGSRTGHVLTAYLVMLPELPYELLQPGDTSEEVRTLKGRMRDLGYLTRRQVNDRFDGDTEKALRKLQMLNGMPETGIATPEFQAFLFHSNVEKSKSGYGASNTDADSGLTISIFAWTSGYTILGGENRGSVEVLIHYATNVSGGSEPYAVMVRSEGLGDATRNPFRITWNPRSPTIYLNATATDEDGNSVSARVKVGILNVLPDPNAID